MSGPQHPDRSVDSINTIRSTYLEIPSQPTDQSPSPRSPRSPRPALSPSPDPSHERRRKRGKNVQWDPSVVDNEHKMQSRPKKSTAAVHPSKSQVASTRPLGHAASSKSPTANTPVKMDLSTIRQPSYYNFVQSRHPMSPPSPTHSRAPTQRPAQTHSGANSASKMVSFPKRKSPTNLRKAPPAVPDAPRAHHPPPAPKPARLPTPDLPEIDESKFFIPKDKLFDFLRGRSDPRGRPVHQKTESQLEVAVAYIQEHKRRGN